MMIRRSMLCPAVAALLAAAAWAALPAPSPAAETPPAPAPVSPAPAAPAPPAARPALDVAKAVEEAIEHAASRIAPAVANILILRRETAGPWDEEDLAPAPDSMPEDLRRYFDRLRRLPVPPRRAQGNGSGVVISPDGFILTSEHVVRDADQIEVTLATRKRYRATVVGSDPRRDLAVIRIQAQGLASAALGDASRLERGQFVLALGSPFGFGRDGQASLSFGIVSGTRRAIPGIGRELDRYYGNLIQTDAAVNPGNSGGPLVNLDGEVVGVNAVISSTSGTSDGVGFAVPITTETRDLIERLKKGEAIAYGFIGVEIQEVGEAEARATGAELGKGAYVARVLADAPGAKAGLREGDVILAIGDAPVHDPDDVIQIVQATPVGGSISLKVLRKGETRSVRLQVARRPPPEEVLASRETGLWWRGLRVEPLTDELRTQTGLKETDQGAFVAEVRDASPAAEAGIIPGMVVNQVGDRKVASVKEFREAVRTLDGACMVHVIGLGVKVIQAPGAAQAPAPPEKPPRKGGKSPPAPPDKPTPAPQEKPPPQEKPVPEESDR